jgi:hypothetical protein
VDQSEYEKITQIAKADFLFFCEYILNMGIGPHHIEWAELLGKEPRILIESARGHGKSWFISKAYPLWLIYRSIQPVDVLTVSFSENQAVELLKMVSDEVMRNPHLAHLRPSSQQKWTATYLEFKGGHKVRGMGFGTSVRGLHPSHIVVDDPLKDEGGMNPEDQFRYFMGALSGTAVRGTQIIVVGTPMDSGDLLEQLESNPKYVFRAYPAISNGVPLFPTLFTLQELRDIEIERGTLAFAREYLLQRVDPATQVFKDQFRMINELQVYPEDVILTRTIIDPAISEKEKACSSAIVTLSQDIKSDNPSQILDEIFKVVEIYKDYPDYAVVIENEVFQKVLAFDLRARMNEKGYNIRVITVRHEGNQGKHQRICGMQAKWEARAIHLLPNSPLIEQHRYYRPNLKGAQIDAIDAAAWMDHPDVSVPFMSCQPVIGEVSDDARA